MLNNDSQHNITESLRQIHQTMTNLESISSSLNEVVSSQKKNLTTTFSNISVISSNLKNNSGQLGHIMDNFSVLSDSLAKLQINKTVEHINMTVTDLNKIISKIDTSRGTLGLLVNDPKLYQNINYSSENLNRLLIDFRQNPKRYVHFSAFDFGRKINITTPGDSQLTDNITYKVQLFSSLTPVSTASPIFKGLEEVSETKSGSNYFYFTKAETSFDKIRMILNNVQGAFPEAVLRCYKNGKEISLENGLKMKKN